MASQDRRIRIPAARARDAALGVGLIFALAAAGPAPSRAADIMMIDAHSQISAEVGLDRALALMDEAGIARVILSAVGRGGVRPLLDFARAHRDRIVPAIGLKPERMRNGDPEALAQLRRMGRNPAFGALSEVMILHQQKGRHAPEIVIGLGSDYAKAALAIARERGWPLVVHIEFGFAASRSEYDSTMATFEALLDANPAMPIVLSHMGQLDPAAARRLIVAHRNVHFLTSHANPIFTADHGTNLPWTELFAGEALAPDWRALFVSHPDRFVLAFDNVYDPDWSDHYVRQARLWRAALAELPPEVANAVAHGNAERLWHLNAASPAAAGPHEMVGPAGLTAREVVARLDRDGDGRLSRSEFRRPPKLFARIDSDHDGFVTSPELEAAWRRYAGAGGRASP